MMRFFYDYYFEWTLNSKIQGQKNTTDDNFLFGYCVLLFLSFNLSLI